MPRKYTRHVAAEVPGQSVEPMHQTRAETIKSERRRQRGATVLTGQKLYFDKSLMDEKKYAYRVINDDGRKIQLRTEMDDYELVDDPAKQIKPDGTDLGSKASVIVGKDENGHPMRGYLARKLRSYYEDDQRDKADENMKTMTAIARPKNMEGRSYDPTSRRLETN